MLKAPQPEGRVLSPAPSAPIAPSHPIAPSAEVEFVSAVSAGGSVKFLPAV